MKIKGPKMILDTSLSILLLEIWPDILWHDDAEFSFIAFFFIPREDNCKDSLYEAIESIVYRLSFNNKEPEPTNFESWNKLKILFPNEQGKPNLSKVETEKNSAEMTIQ